MTCEFPQNEILSLSTFFWLENLFCYFCYRRSKFPLSTTSRTLLLFFWLKTSAATVQRKFPLNNQKFSFYTTVVSGYLRRRSYFLSEDSQQEVTLLVRREGAGDDEVAAWRKLVATNPLPDVGKRGRASHGHVVSEEVNVLRPNVSIGNL